MARIPIFALTALTQENDRTDALAAGCDGVVIKPFATDDLIEQGLSHLGAGSALPQ